MLRAAWVLRAALVGAIGVASAAGCPAGVESEPSGQPARSAEVSAERAAAAYELSHSPFGLHVITGDLDGPLEIGARWTRHLVLWKQVEPRRGAIRPLDEVVPRLNELSEAGIEVVPRIVSVAPWAHSRRINALNAEAAGKRAPMGDWTYLGMPTDLAAYRRFLTTIVEAFDGDGIRDAPGLKRPVRYWQVENEWDWRWKDSPESFVEFLKIAHETIKAADPEAKVVLGGISKLAPDAFHAGLLGDSYQLDGKTITPASLGRQQRFREEHSLRKHVLEHGHPYFDIISFHQYGRYQAIEQEVEYLRGIMLRHHYEKPLWMTEAGGPFTGHGEVYTEDGHAREVVKYYVTALANGVDVVFWSTYLPTPEWGTAFTNTALLDQRRRKKPAYHSYKLLASKLRGAVRVERLFSSERAQLARFTRESGTPLYVAWRDGGSGADALPERLGSWLDEKSEGRAFEITAYDGSVRTSNDLRREIGALLARGPLFVEPR